MSRINLRVLPRLRPACASRGLHATPRTRIDETIRKGDLYEYSVVYTDRVYNLMSSPFQECMREISASLKTVYNAQTSVVIPGSGTYAMEAVARQFATGNKTLILRHGFFSYRWSQILEQGGISNDNVVLKAVATSADPLPQFKPLELDDIEQRILVGVFVDVLILLQQEKPKVVFAPHVETSTGIILPDEYLRRIGDAARRVGALFVLDGIASGTVWVDMEACNVDVFISAPQKGWSGPACCGLVMLNGRATETLKETQSSSFTLDLKQWVDVMAAYEGGAFKYYTTLPTDALMTFRDAMQETRAMGLDEARAAMLSLGTGVRAAAEVNPFTPSLDLPQAAGFKSVAAPGFAAPGVAVFYAPTPNMVPEFKARGMQIAAGVPWFLDEPQGLNTFRLGLFGLDKLKNVDVATKRVSEGMQDIAASLK